MEKQIPISVKTMLLLPAIAGWLLHLPLWFPVKLSAKKFGAKNDHYDSLVVGLLFVLYPVYLLLMGFLFTAFFSGGWALMAIIGAPFLAWSYMYIKPQF